MGSMGGGGSNQVQETAHEKELTRIAVEQWGRFKEAVEPKVDEYMETIPTTEQQRDQISGEAAAQVERRFGAPGYEKRAAIGGLGIEEGKVAGAATAGARRAADNSEYRRLEQMIAQGRGEEAQATQGMRTLATNAVNESIGNARAEEDKRDTIGSSVMTAAGMGLAAAKGTRDMNSPLYSPKEGDYMTMNRQPVYGGR